MQAADKRLQRLKPYSHSPVVWFRNPYAHIILVRAGVAGGRDRMGSGARRFLMRTKGWAPCDVIQRGG